MTAKVFDGRALALTKEIELAKKMAVMVKKPKLVSIVVGDDPTSHLYVDLKRKAAERVGIGFEKVEFKVSSKGGSAYGRKGEKLKIEEVISLIENFNKDKSVTGIMVQLPLPPTLKGYSFKVVGAIAPDKDVDGLTGKGKFLPATVKAVLDILASANVVLAGKQTVVVGRSKIVGQPLAQALTERQALVTVAHSQTPDLGEVTNRADILISATGKPGLVTQDMVKPGVVVVDVGEPKGDVADEVRQVASFITPVPGGVGPVTVACLLENIVEAA